MADTATTPAAHSDCAERGVIIKEPALAKPTPKKVLAGKGKKKPLLLRHKIPLPHLQVEPGEKPKKINSERKLSSKNKRTKPLELELLNRGVLPYVKRWNNIL